MRSLLHRLAQIVVPPKQARRSLILVGCVLATLGIAWVDAQVGIMVRLDALYFVLVGVAAWFTGVWGAYLVASLAVVFGLFPDLLQATEAVPASVVVWNAGGTLVVYLASALVLAALRRSLELRRDAARTDLLTGLANRRALNEALAGEVQRARRYSTTFAVAYLDLDGFKQINDTLGHEAGDRVLGTVGATLAREVRDADLAARVGGDEFVVLMPETDLTGARTLMERVVEVLRREFERHGIEKLTTSVGVHASTGLPQEPEEIIRRADDLMYEAKRDGKDRIQAA